MLIHFESSVVGDGWFTIIQRGIAGGRSEIYQIVAAGMGIFIDFDG